MKIIVWNSQDKCVADCRKLIRGCDVLCLLDCGQWTVPAHALQVQNGLYYWKDKNSSYDVFYCLERVAFICRDGLYSGVSVLATDELIFTMLTVPIPQSAIVQTRSSDVICFASFLYIINITTMITATTIKLTIISLADMLMVFVSAVYCKDEFNIPEFLPKNI